MQNKEVGQELPQPKKGRVIVIQDKRKQGEARPVDSSLQVQQTPPRHAFKLNMIQGNQQSAIVEEVKKPEPELPAVEPRAEQQLNPVQFEFVFQALMTMKAEVSRLSDHLETLDDRIARLEEQRTGEAGATRKKIRRRAQEIIKNFACPYQSCQKAYGSEVSLNLHIRLKHTAQQADSKSGSGSVRPSPIQGERGYRKVPQSDRSHSGSDSNLPDQDSK